MCLPLPSYSLKLVKITPKHNKKFDERLHNKYCRVFVLMGAVGSCKLSLRSVNGLEDLESTKKHPTERDL